ncbi:hypothetical protein RIF29_29244 [Crotalaria pallida]|uniref:Uncharacterized protein n=1 Tax=Crotalaria pallida TaxID=3830 RepID=A0AAN9EED9_CROPI
MCIYINILVRIMMPYLIKYNLLNKLCAFLNSLVFLRCPRRHIHVGSLSYPLHLFKLGVWFDHLPSPCCIQVK